MSSWRKTPPTTQEWLDADNHGMWWVKFKLTDIEEDVDEDGKPCYWPEVWYTDCVAIMAEGFPGNKDERLIAEGSVILKRFYLNDPEATKDLYWQPVKSPDNDIKDKRPEVDNE